MHAPEPFPNSLATRLGAMWRGYPAWLLRHHRSVVVTALVIAVGGALLAATLPLRTEFSWLLPDDQPSVVALSQLTARKPSSAVIEVGIASPSAEVTRRFAADLAGALRKNLPPDLLREVDADDGDVRRFVWEHRHLYAPLADLETAVDALRARVRAAEQEHNPFLVDLEDAAPPVAPVAAAPLASPKLDELRGKLDKARRAYEREPGYIGEDGRLRMLVVRCPFGDTEPQKGVAALKAIAATVAQLDPKSYDPQLDVGYAGDPVSAAQEHDLVLRDVAVSTSLCLFLVASVLLLVFRAPRAVLALCVTLAIGCATTFGFTRLWIGHLNTSTAFLGSVVAGNGINFGVILLARYLEERRRFAASHALALRTALARTSMPTLVACAAAGSAYLSLTITSFRGFSEFGIIAGSGMMFCWLASYLVLPSLLTWLDGRRSLVGSAPGTEATAPSRAIWIVRRGRLVGGVAVTLVSLTTGLGLLGAFKLARNPFEDDLRALRSRSYPSSASGKWSHRLDASFGRDQSGGFYLGVAHPEDALAVVEALHNAERDVPPAERVFGKIDALSEVLPGDAAAQGKKVALLGELRRLSDKALGQLDDNSADAKLLEELRPPPEEALRPVTFADLPERLRSAFTENDGRVGLLLAVHPGPGFENWSHRSIRRAVTLLRGLDLPDAVRATLQMSGPEVIFVDMMSAVEHEGPRASLLSLCLVLVMLLAAFGLGRSLSLTAFALFIGLFGMLGLMQLFGVRLNFLNYIAVPITIGIGVDYPFNVIARVRQERRRGGAYDDGALRGVMQTAVAVVLCSLTTMIGYAVLLLSDTGAIRSFGAASVLGEITSIIAAVLVVPALLLVGRLRQRRLTESARPVWGPEHVGAHDDDETLRLKANAE